jgi:hypothetical protein
VGASVPVSVSMACDFTAGTTARLPGVQSRRRSSYTRADAEPAERRARGAVQTILVANPKGGSGKTTLATNIAGWLAGKRQKVAVADADPQRSATRWLDRRPPLFPAVEAVDGDARRKDVQWLVVDSAAGLHGEALRDAVKRADSPARADLALGVRHGRHPALPRHHRRLQGDQARRPGGGPRGHARGRAHGVLPASSTSS